MIVRFPVSSASGGKLSASGTISLHIGMASSSVMNNEKAFWREFIELYRNNECLWRVKSKSYIDGNKKNEAYQTLLGKLKEYDAEATIYVHFLVLLN